MAKGDFDYSNIARERKLSKTKDVLPGLARLAKDDAALSRIDRLATAISARLDAINVAAPAIDGKRTNPFVLAAHARKSKLESPFDLDVGLAAAKEFSGLETALGRIVEDIVPPTYGWEQVHSEAHSLLTEIDSAKKVSGVVRLAALKSGPACMNDTMVNKIGGAVADNYAAWAAHWGVKQIDYTVGMNYSTGRNSNKKDWHAVRLAEEKLKAAGARVIESCVGATAGRRPLAQPGFLAEKSGIRVRMCVRQGIEFWGHIADPVPDAYLELCCALTAAASPRAALGQAPKATRTEQLLDVVDVPAIAKAAKLPGKMSAAQLPWLLLFVRHYVDDLTD